MQRHNKGTPSVSSFSNFNAEPISGQTLVDDEAIETIQRNLDETRRMAAQVDAALEKEDAKQIELKNHMNMVNGTVNELIDALGKSKRREIELVKQIDSWIDLIKKERMIIEHEDERFQKTSEESEQLCDDLEFNIGLLKEKRKNIDDLVLQLARIRKENDDLVRDLRDELKRGKDELEAWDNRLLANKQPLKRLCDRKKTVSDELTQSKARLAKTHAACESLKKQIEASSHDWTPTETSQVAPQIIQGSPVPAVPQPLKAQMVSLAPVVVDEKRKSGSESAVEPGLANSPVYAQKRTTVPKESTPLRPLAPNRKPDKTQNAKPASPAFRSTRDDTTSWTEKDLRSPLPDSKFDTVVFTESKADLCEHLRHLCDPNKSSNPKPEDSTPSQNPKEFEKAKMRSPIVRSLRDDTTSQTEKDLRSPLADSKLNAVVLTKSKTDLCDQLRHLCDPCNSSNPKTQTSSTQQTPPRQSGSNRKPEETQKAKPDSPAVRSTRNDTSNWTEKDLRSPVSDSNFDKAVLTKSKADLCDHLRHLCDPCNRNNSGVPKTQRDDATSQTEKDLRSPLTDSKFETVVLTRSKTDLCDQLRHLCDAPITDSSINRLGEKAKNESESAVEPESMNSPVRAQKRTTVEKQPSAPQPSNPNRKSDSPVVQLSKDDTTNWTEKDLRSPLPDSKFNAVVFAESKANLCDQLRHLCDHSKSSNTKPQTLLSTQQTPPRQSGSNRKPEENQKTRAYSPAVRSTRNDTSNWTEKDLRSPVSDSNFDKAVLTKSKADLCDHLRHLCDPCNRNNSSSPKPPLNRSILSDKKQVESQSCSPKPQPDGSLVYNKKQIDELAEDILAGRRK